MISVRENRILNTIVVSNIANENINFKAKPPQRTDLNTFTYSKFKRMLDYTLVYQAENKNQNVFFVTITTYQSINKKTDAECVNVLSKWLELRKKQKVVENYVWWAERQKNGSIHFHIILWSYNHKIKIMDQVEYFKKYFGTGTNGFNVQKVKNEKNNLIDVVKYLVHYSKKHKQDTYKSKVCQASIGVTKCYKSSAYKYIIVSKHSDNYIEQIKGEKKVINEYVTLFKNCIFE